MVLHLEALEKMKVKMKHIFTISLGGGAILTNISIPSS